MSLNEYMENILHHVTSQNATQGKNFIKHKLLINAVHRSTSRTRLRNVARHERAPDVGFYLYAHHKKTKPVFAGGKLSLGWEVVLSGDTREFSGVL